MIVSWKMNTNRSHRQITVGYLKILLLLDHLLLDRIHARFPRLDAFEGRSQISKPKFNDSTLLFGHHTGPLIDHITKFKSFWHHGLGLMCCGALTGWAISVYSSQMIEWGTQHAEYLVIANLLNTVMFKDECTLVRPEVIFGSRVLLSAGISSSLADTPHAANYDSR